MRAADDGAPYDVGFGKPPKRSRFRKGSSGNPKGRPKGKCNLATVLDRILQEKIVLHENGKERIVTKLEAAIEQLVNKAASGDLIALRQLTILTRSAEERAVEAPTKQLSEVDLKIMQRVLQRQGRCVNGKGETSEHQ